MCRSIVRFFVAVLIILFSLLTALLWTIKLQLLEAPYYKNFLRKNDVYNTALETGRSYFTGKDEEEGVIIAQPAIDILFEKILTPEIVQDTAERNLDNIFGFLNGREERFELYFPKQYILQELDIQTIDNFENEINSIIASLPTCTPAQLTEMQGEEIGLTSKVECLPPDFQYEQRDLSEMIKQIQEYTGENPFEQYLSSFLPEGSSPDEVDIAAFIKNSPREPGAPDPEVFFQSAQMYFSYFMWSLVGLTFLTLLLILVYVLLGEKKNWLKSLGWIFIIMAIPWFLSGMSFILLSNYYAYRLTDRFFTGIPEQYRELLNSVPDLAAKFTTGVFVPLVISAVFAMFIGAVLLIINKLKTGKDAEPTKEQKN